MSWQAQTAVFSHSTQRTPTALRVLGVLAGYADPVGNVDPAPSQATIAETLGVTEKTVRRNLQTIIASGELSVKREAGGRGKPAAYQIILPLEKGDMQQKKGDICAEKGGHLAQIDTRKGDIDQEKGDMALLYRVTLLEKKVDILENKGGHIRRKRGTYSARKGDIFSKKGGHASGVKASLIHMIQYDPIGSKEEEEGLGLKTGLENQGQTATAQISPPLVVSSKSLFSQNVPNGQTKKETAVNPNYTVEARIAALAEVCGLNLGIASHAADCRKVAKELYQYSANAIRCKYSEPPPSPPPHLWFWFLHDWRGLKGEKPTLKQVVQTISNTPPKPKQNGVNHDSNSGFNKKGTASGSHPAFKVNTPELIAAWENGEYIT